MRLGIRLDTALIGIRTICGNAIHGVKPASILFTTPSWLSVALDTAQVTPMACNSAILEQGKHRFGYFALRGAGVAGALIAALRLLGVL